MPVPTGKQTLYYVEALGRAICLREDGLVFSMRWNPSRRRACFFTRAGVEAFRERVVNSTDWNLNELSIKETTAYVGMWM